MDSEEFLSKITNSFRNDVIKEALKMNCPNPKMKITDEAVALTSELLKVLVVESALRAAKQCTSENKTTVSLSHIESVLTQIMLDFP